MSVVLSTSFPSISSIILAFFLTVFLFYFYRLLDAAVLQPYRRYRILAQQGIKGPTFKPFIGDALTIKRYSDEYKRLVMGNDMRAKYGLINHWMLGPFNMLGLGDPDYVLAAYKTQHQHYHKGVITKTMLGSLFGMESIILTDNPAHDKRRKLIAPAFHYAKLSSMASIMINETQRKIDEVSSLDEIELHQFFTQLTFAIIMSSSFGNSLDTIPHASSTIHHALSVTLPIMQKRQLALIEYIPLLRDLPILGKTEVEKGKADVKRVLTQMIRDRRAGKSQSNCEGDDLLDILLNARDPETGEGFSDEVIRSDSLTFVLAGHETTSSLMTFVVRDLLLRRDVLEKCRQEVERVTEGGPLLTHHLPSLTLIDACIHESFRLRPPVPGIAIQAGSDHYLQPPGRDAIFVSSTYPHPSHQSPHLVSSPAHLLPSLFAWLRSQNTPTSAVTSTTSTPCPLCGETPPSSGTSSAG